MGQECQQSVWVLEEATTEWTAPPAGMEGDYLCLKSIHSDAYIHFFAIVDSDKNHPASYDSLTLFLSPVSRVTAYCLLAAFVSSPYTEKNNAIFL